MVVGYISNVTRYELFVKFYLLLLRTVFDRYDLVSTLSGECEDHPIG